MCVVGSANVSGYVCLVEIRSILDARKVKSGKWGMLRGPSAPICSGASCWAPFLAVSALRVVAMGVSVESSCAGACG